MWDIPLDAHIHASINQVYNGLITINKNSAAWSHAQLICCNVLKKVIGIFLEVEHARSHRHAENVG